MLNTSEISSSESYQCRQTLWLEPTGDAQEVTLNRGTYLFEAWGASGHYGSYTRNDASRGGYASGILSLNEQTTFYIYVGTGDEENIVGGFNGGGNSGTKGGVAGAGGGGATDIRLVGGPWNDSFSLQSRIMVAGGGSGAGSQDISQGHGGGLSGGSSRASNYGNYGGNGGSQTAGGPVPHNYGKTVGITPGVFGVGGNGSPSQSTGWGSGGGGGYFGGSGASGANTGHWGGGGGSSFISGHPGANAIDSNGLSTGQPVHFSGFVFSNTFTEAGVRRGHGLVKITKLSSFIGCSSSSNGNPLSLGDEGVCSLAEGLKGNSTLLYLEIEGGFY